MNTSNKFLSILLLLSGSIAWAAQQPKNVNTAVAVKGVTIDATSDLTVRYVNTMEAMQVSKRGQEVQKELEAKRDELMKKVKKEEDKIKNVLAEFKSKESTLNKNARNEEEAKIVKMQREYETLVKGCEDDLKVAMQQVTEELSAQVEKTVADMAKANGYDVVADTFTGRTVYVSEKAMVTADLVKSMDKKHVAKAPGAKKTATA